MYKDLIHPPEEVVKKTTENLKIETQDTVAVSSLYCTYSTSTWDKGNTVKFGKWPTPARERIPVWSIRKKNNNNWASEPIAHYSI